jgi:transcriptional regulator with XRE-family HTH domain
MKQPELGKIITNLRNEKGLTQEELVDKCNISVRTIQRIEAGEVTPRSFTIKTILAALDYNLENIKTLFPNEEKSNWSVSKNQLLALNLAIIAGVIYFFIGFIEVYFDLDIEDFKTVNSSTSIYISVKLISLISMVFLYTGFVVSGTIFSNYLLRISSIVAIFTFGMGYVFDIFTWYNPLDSEEYFLVVLSIIFGCAYVLNGIGVLRLKSHLDKNLPTLTGIVLIVTGATFIVVFLFLIGVFLLIPLTILQIILLYKIKEKIAKQ